MKQPRKQQPDKDGRGLVPSLFYIIMSIKNPVSTQIINHRIAKSYYQRIAYERTTTTPVPKPKDPQKLTEAEWVSIASFEHDLQRPICNAIIAEWAIEDLQKG